MRNEFRGYFDVRPIDSFIMRVCVNIAEAYTRATLHSCPRLKDIVMFHEKQEGAPDQAQRPLALFLTMTG